MASDPLRSDVDHARLPWTAHTLVQEAKQRLKSQGWSVTEFGDPNLLAAQGGVVIPGPEGAALGGIGVSGLSAEEDEQIAKVSAIMLKWLSRPFSLIVDTKVGLQAITSR